MRSSSILSRLCLVVGWYLVTPPPSASALSAPGGAALAKTAWSAYKASLLTNPLPTKATTSMIISGISDTIVQRSTNPKEKTPVKNDDMEMTMEEPSVQVTYKHNWKRTYHVLLTGFVYSAPIAHYWYNFLEILVSKIPAIQGDPLIGIVARIGLDMVLFSPVTIAGYFSVRTLLETKSLQACRSKLRQAWWPTLKGAWKFWPVVNLYNFWKVPVEFRVLYANVMSLLWTGFLTYVNSQKGKALSSLNEKA